MQLSFLTNLRHSLSNELVGPYLRFDPRSQMEALPIYTWNIALCESLYPSLHNFEIGLRNRIHALATGHFGNENWFSGRLRTQEEEMLSNARSRIDPAGLRSVSAEELVRDLSLGFWVNLFKGRYERILWPQLLSGVFPGATKRQRAREHLYQRLNRIRRLRNSVVSPRAGLAPA